MGKMEKAAPAVTLEAVTVPLADGRRSVVLVLTDEYSRKTVMRAMPAICDPQKNPDARAAPGFLFYSAAVASAASAGSSNAGGVVPPVCSGVPLVLLKTSLDSLEKTSFAYST